MVSRLDTNLAVDWALNVQWCTVLPVSTDVTLAVESRCQSQFIDRDLIIAVLIFNNNNNNSGHFYSDLSHQQGGALRALRDQQKCIHKTSKIMMCLTMNITLYSSHTTSAHKVARARAHTHTHTHTHTRATNSQRRMGIMLLLVVFWFIVLMLYILHST